MRRGSRSQSGTTYHIRMLVDDGAGGCGRPSGPRAPTSRTRSSTHAVAVVPGTPGILLVHPESRRSCDALVTSYALGSGRPFGPTPPALVATISGIPCGPPGRTRSIARVWSAYPAHVSFEWSYQDTLGSPVRTPETAVLEPPYTSSVNLPAGARPVRWQARLRSASSGAEIVSQPHEIAPHDPAQPLVMLAASCVQLTGVPANEGFGRLEAAAPRAPAALVFQGDAGYANNAHDACYAQAPGLLRRPLRAASCPTPTSPACARTVAGRLHDGRPRLRAAQQRRQAPPSSRGRRRSGTASTPTRRPLEYFDFRVRRRALPDARRAPVRRPGRRAQHRRARRSSGIRAVRLDARHPADERRRDVRRLHRPTSSRTRENLRTPTRGAGDRLLHHRLAGRVPAEHGASSWTPAAGAARVLILSGDAHGLRVHYHPDPRWPAGRRPAVRGGDRSAPGCAPRLWSGAVPTDPSASIHAATCSAIRAPGCS